MTLADSIGLAGEKEPSIKVSSYTPSGTAEEIFIRPQTLMVLALMFVTSPGNGAALS
jgi:hypothetical protein